MAYTDMDDFLKRYYKQLHIYAMPTDVLARLVDYKKDGILTEHQQDWFDNYLEADPESSLGYKSKDVPKPTNENELSKEELKKLYKAFALAMAGMKGNSIFWDKYNDEGPLQFLDEWFEQKKMFSIPAATDETEDAITALMDVLSNSQEKQNIKQIILKGAKKPDKPDEQMFGSIEEIDKFLDEKVKGKKYNSDIKVQTKLQTIAYVLYENLNAYSFNDTQGGTAVKRALAPIGTDLQILYRDDAFSKIDVTNDIIQKFGEGQYAEELLERLYYDIDVREKFEKYDSKKIVEKITKFGEGKIKWHDKESVDYVKPKIEDQLNPVQWLEKQAKDTYNNTLKKYEELRGAHLFQSPQAKDICKAIDKEEIKPSDGLEGLLGKVQAVKDRINNKKVAEHFDWFVETIKDIQNDAPKAVAGAWKDAKQMKLIIDRIILKAVGQTANNRNQGSVQENMEKAKTAMELMTVMKYGALTSNLVDAINGSEFSLFSDGSLSWNKNEAIKFITTAFDKSIKFALKGFGYGLSFARNKYFMRKLEYTKDDNKRAENADGKNGRLANAYAREQQRLQRFGDPANKKEELRTEINRLEREDLQQKQNRVNTIGESEVTFRDGRKIKVNALDDEKQRIDGLLAAHKKSMTDQSALKDKARQHQNRYKDQMDELEESVQAYNEAKYIASGQEEKDILEEISNIDAEIKKLEEKIKDLNKTANASGLLGADGKPLVSQAEKNAAKMEIEEHKQKLAELQSQKAEVQQKLDKIKSDPDRVEKAKLQLKELQPAYDKYQEASRSYDEATTMYNTADDAYTDAERRYNDIKADSEYDLITSKSQEFHNATDELDELNKSIENKNKILETWDEDHVNRVAYLESYWNYLQTGQLTTYRLNTKNAQKDFDKVDEDTGQMYKQKLLAKYMSEHGL